MHSAQSCRKALKHLAQRKDGAALYAARCPAFLPLLTRHFGHVTFFPVTRPNLSKRPDAQLCANHTE